MERQKIIYLGGGASVNTGANYTWTGTHTFSGEPLILSGNRNYDDAGSDQGQYIRQLTSTLTHTIAVTNSYTMANSLAGPTIAASVASDLLIAATLYLTPPIAGSNMTLTNRFALYTTHSIWIATGGIPAYGAPDSIAGDGMMSVIGTHASTAGGSFHAAVCGLAEYQSTNNGSARYVGGYFAAQTAHGSTGNMTVTSVGGLVGVRGEAQHSGIGTVSLMIGIESHVNGEQRDLDAARAAVDVASFCARAPSIPCALDTWTTHRAFWVKGDTISGTITTRYGLYVDDLQSGTTRWAIYTVTDKSYFGGEIVRPGGVTPLISTNAAITSGAAAQTGTLTNSPAAGNPTKWIPINDNGTTRYIPAW